MMPDERASHPLIAVDGVFFQIHKTGSLGPLGSGIGRVWTSLLAQWAANDFGKHLLILNRGGFTPRFDGIRYREIPLHDFALTEADRSMLQSVCDEENVDVFVSTFWTSPTQTRSVHMVHDLLQEVLRWDMRGPVFAERNTAFHHASAYVAISHNSAKDFKRFYPELAARPMTVAYPGVAPDFSPASPEQAFGIRAKYGITRPYFLVVGARWGYKNLLLFFTALAALTTRGSFDVVCTGGSPVLEPHFRSLTAGTTVHMLMLSDEELRSVYSGALALIYPSKYEGFGLPILEAMACGCPVITCANASIPEVAGDAAIFVSDSNPSELADALYEVQKPSVRQRLIRAGRQQAAKFSWEECAKAMREALLAAFQAGA